MNQSEHPLNHHEHDARVEPQASFFGNKMTPGQLLTGRSRRIVAIIAVIVVIVVLVPLMAANKSQDETLGTATVLTVKTQTAKPVDQYDQSRVYTGIIRPKRASDLSFELNGEVIELWADAGSKVEADQLLARLDTRGLAAQRDQLVAQLNQSKANLHELVAGPRKETIEANRAEVKSLAAQLELAKLNRKRREELVSTRSIAREEYDRALYDQQAATESLNAAQKRLDELEAGTRPEQIDAQKAMVAQLNANIRAIDIQLDKSTLKAPYSGVISQRLLDEGSTAVATQSVFRIVEADQLEAWIGLPVEMAREVASGKFQTLRINGQQVESAGKRLVPELNSATRTQTVIFELPKIIDASIVPGQIVRIELEQTKSASGFWVPSTSLVQSLKGLWSVFVVQSTNQEKRVARRDVEIIENDGDQSLVRGTLQAGDEVIVEGVHRVVPGQLVEIAN
jgi:multidrug efflux pump subunit AcrA (membrane-fusion protein)